MASQNKLDLGAFLVELGQQHEELTQKFEAAQIKARVATAECRGARDALAQFRQAYGGHLKLMTDGSVEVEAGG